MLTLLITVVAGGLLAAFGDWEEHGNLLFVGLAGVGYLVPLLLCLNGGF